MCIYTYICVYETETLYRQKQSNITQLVRVCVHELIHDGARQASNPQRVVVSSSLALISRECEYEGRGQKLPRATNVCSYARLNTQEQMPLRQSIHCVCTFGS